MISSKTIENAIYNLCVQANTVLNDTVFQKILDAYNQESNIDVKQSLQLILKNAKMAYETKKPLCQDTGQVLVFAKIGTKCNIENFNDSINNGVKKAYEENYYRKSVVKNALFDRSNTNTNAPCVIYTEVTDSDEIEFEILIKGAGAENMSTISMLSPTASEEEIIDFVTTTVQKAGTKACPPLFIGIGIGGTMEYAGLLSKKALISENTGEQHKLFSEKIKNAVNKLNIGTAGLGGKFTSLDVKILTDFTHIASMPVAITINCHSSRHAKCKITQNDVIYFPQKLVENYIAEETKFENYIKINTNEIEKLRELKIGQKVLLSGEVYTARDQVHKKLVEMLKNGEKLPFDLKNKIIFYAGPCPCDKNCVVGSIGPTTSSRMDKYAPALYENGILATIGKGERSEEVKNAIKEIKGLYFSINGGIACYLSEKFTKKELIAFEDLGTEALYRFTFNDLPLRVEIG